MNGRSVFAAVVVASVQLVGLSAGYAYYTSAINLESYCGRNITILCPLQYSGKAGTVRFWLIPQADCKVNVTLEESCGHLLDRFAIYFNIRKFNLPYADKVRIYESGALIKELIGYESASNNPASVAQVRTGYSRRPAVTFEYDRGTSVSSGANEAFFDYVIVEEQSSYRSTYCTALSGYINDDYICDTDGYTDRVNCPSVYSPVTYGRNPAYGRQYCRSSSNSYAHSGLSSGAITGIIMAVIIFVVGVITVGVSASRRRSGSAPRVMSSSAGAVTFSRAVVVGQTESVRPFSAAPPSYDQVTGPGGAAAYPAPPAPKF